MLAECMLVVDARDLGLRLLAAEAIVSDRCRCVSGPMWYLQFRRGGVRYGRSGSLWAERANEPLIRDILSLVRAIEQYNPKILCLPRSDAQ